MSNFKKISSLCKSVHDSANGQVIGLTEVLIPWSETVEFWQTQKQKEKYLTPSHITTERKTMKHRHKCLIHAFPTSAESCNGKKSTSHCAVVAGSMLALVAFSPTTAMADITNTATATGTYGGNPTTSAGSTVNVPVISLSRSMTTAVVVQSGPTTALGGNASGTDGSDTITYRYTITNTGNATETSVTPYEADTPTFNGQTGTGSFGSFTEVTGLGAGTGSASSLAPGETVVFDVTYTLSNLDAFNAAGVTDGVSNTAAASSTALTNVGASTAALATITAYPELTIAKTFVLDDTNGTSANEAEVGETITYTYTVTNTGNVALTSVGVNDTHEGTPLATPPAGEAISTEGPVQASDLGTLDDGVIDVLEAGAIATFTYVHTVTQAEVDAQ